jgi:hypothetical protein
LASCRRYHRCGGIDSSPCAMWQQAGCGSRQRHARVGARRANVQSACFIVNSCQQQKLTIATKSCAHATRIPLAFVALGKKHKTKKYFQATRHDFAARAIGERAGINRQKLYRACRMRVASMQTNINNASESDFVHCFTRPNEGIAAQHGGYCSGARSTQPYRRQNGHLRRMGQEQRGHMMMSRGRPIFTKWARV